MIVRKIVRVLVGAAGSVTAVVLATACGDVYADPDPDPSDSSIVIEDAGILEDSSSIAPSVFPEDTFPRCPMSRPRENSSCSQPGSTCEYGTSADTECNTTVACEGAELDSAWVPRPRDTCFSEICPSTGDVSTLDGKPCTLEMDGGAVTDADEAVCNMSDGICACTTGRDAMSQHERRWVCTKPVLSLCPPNRPLLGTPCTGTAWCDYGSCKLKRGTVMECVLGVWLSGGATCE